jgi:hypothetical protein
MKIREGAYYRRRDGEVVGPMVPSKHRIGAWVINDHAWYEDGRFLNSGVPHMMDLISEVYVSDTPPAVKETAEELREMMRDPRYWQKREPEWVKRVTEGFRALVGGDTPPAAPETKTLRDEFAMAALKAMLGHSDYVELSPAKMAVEAYRQADAMMEERKK